MRELVMMVIISTLILPLTTDFLEAYLNAICTRITKMCKEIVTWLLLKVKKG